MNQVNIVGRLGADPELRQTQGDPVCTLRIATTERWKNRESGEMQEATEWHRVVVWGAQATNCERYLSKGKLVGIFNAQLRTRKWQDQSGADRYSTEIVCTPQSKVEFLSPKESGDRRDDGPQGDMYGGQAPRQSRQPSGNASTGGRPALQGGSTGREKDTGQTAGTDDFDDDIPF